MEVNKELSYDYENLKRDLSDVFEVVVKKRPVLSTVIGVTTEKAEATTHEWLEDVVNAKAWTLNGAYTAGAGTITLVSTEGLVAGTIITFEQASGASSTFTAKVVSVDSATVITVANYGDDSVDENLTDSSNVKLVAYPKGESTEATANNGREPTAEYNYTQIFDRTAKVSKTAQSVKKYGIEDAISYQVENQLIDLGYEMVASIIYGKRVKRSASEAGTMGGILYYLGKGTGNKVDASGAPLSIDLLNDGLAKGDENGATGINMIVGHTNQIRKVGAFNNDQIRISQEDRKRGNYVTDYVGDLGDLTTLVADRNFPKDKVALLDDSKMTVMALVDRDFSDEDATPKGADYYARRILGEYTFELKNKSTHILIEDLEL